VRRVAELKFWKMHGLGNDFIIIDNKNNRINDEEAAILAKKLCDRKFGVGADGILFLSKSKVAEVRMRIFNSDGSEAEMCGNGIRCLAKYCYENKVSRKTELAVETLAGIEETWLTVENHLVTSVRVDMGLPVFERVGIPMQGIGTCLNEDLRIEDEIYKITCLSMGNPHCVIFVDNVVNFPVENAGPKIEANPLFPKKTNVEFVQVLNRGEVKVRVWERGCGETLACGTGACASVVAGKLLNNLDSTVTVHLRGGDLNIEYADRVFMIGSAERVYKGKLFRGF
jgi:diaminopimelate epimerase